MGIKREKQKLVTRAGVVLSAGEVVIPKSQGYGVKVDIDDPDYPWQDLLGEVRPKTSGNGTPTLTAFRGGQVQAFSFAANDFCDFIFHIPHDHVPCSPLHLHTHWAHNGTAISGQLVMDYYITYAKGHYQDIFAPELTLTQTVTTSSIGSHPRWQHFIEETQLTAASPSSAQFNCNVIEPDGVILARVKATTIPTVTGGNTFILFSDLHYQSTNIGTKQKSPDFWT